MRKVNLTTLIVIKTMSDFGCYLCNLAKAGGVNRSVLGDGHSVPSFILRLACPPTSRCVGAPATHIPSHPASSSSSSAAAAFFLWHKLLLDFDLFPVLLHLCILVDLVNCFRALVSSTRHPVILWFRNGTPVILWFQLTYLKSWWINTHFSEVQDILQHEANSGWSFPLFDNLVHLVEILIHTRLSHEKGDIWVI